MADNGLITVSSAHGVKETIDRFENDVKSKGMTIFARIDHAAGAEAVGLTLRPTELLIFGIAAIPNRTFAEISAMRDLIERRAALDDARKAGRRAIDIHACAP